MINLKKSEWIILIGLLLLSFVPCVGGIFRLVDLVSDSGLVPENPRIQSAPIPVILHILSAVPYCILGAFQFLPSVMRMYPKWHRLAGRLLGIAGLISAISGLWMTHYYSFPDDLQGNLLYCVRIIVGFAMIANILLGIAAIFKKRIVQHRAWMIRAYALGQGAGTQVLVTIPWLLTVGEPSGLTRDILMTVAWVINIIVAEGTINNRSKYWLTALRIR
ncbi:DUF2306 domain-containing protein [Calothrix rhizosoleniae]|uniref:DUF2306 domain-containing protein n=1 Tax=Calothrix rhizosoleniae TaxID=888997 RepID=UPI000B49D367|nr:DUF2306 domain-containing protein [Calothrix rhizosoleniae]